MYPLTAGPTVPPSHPFPVPTPVQFGVPGAMELVVILLIAVVLFGIPLVAFVGLFAYLRGIDRKVDRIESRLEVAGDGSAEGEASVTNRGVVETGEDDGTTPDRAADERRGRDGSR